jgi:hypothetical protein
MIENSLTTRGLAHPNPQTLRISPTQFRCIFSKKSADPHPPYPVEPLFCPLISRNKLRINGLHFKHVYQSVTANRLFCLSFSLKNRCFRAKYSSFR